VDRDVYLILVGAGIALASNIVMRILEFILATIAQKIRWVYEAQLKEKQELRQSLLGADIPGPDKLNNIQKILIALSRGRGGLGMRAEPLVWPDHIINAIHFS
jgi:hypothetical protein